MTKEEYIKRFAAHMCKVSELPPDDRMAIDEAEIYWDEHACKDDEPKPEDDADEAMSHWDV